MTLLNNLKEIAEDLTSLEVATLTSTDGFSLTTELESEQTTELNNLRGTLKNAESDLSNNVDEEKEAELKKAVKQARNDLKKKENEFGVFQANNTFARIRAVLGTSENVQLVAYSRFELDGDAVNYIDNDPSRQTLVESHKNLVDAAQNSRESLFNTVIGGVKGINNH